MFKFNGWSEVDITVTSDVEARPSGRSQQARVVNDLTARRAEEIRKRVGDLDPLELRALAVSTAASDKPDTELVYALLSANPSVYPRIAAALDADTKQNVATSLRYRNNPERRHQVVEDLTALRCLHRFVKVNLETGLFQLGSEL
jgi:hypothetical protein